jgi:hypothetical protein
MLPGRTALIRLADGLAAHGWETVDMDDIGRRRVWNHEVVPGSISVVVEEFEWDVRIGHDGATIPTRLVLDVRTPWQNLRDVLLLLTATRPEDLI